MAELDDLAEQTLSAHKLPTTFSYRQAFILGYNKRKLLAFKAMYGGRLDAHSLENQDVLARLEVHKP